MLGNAYESQCIGTGFGTHIALPMMRTVLEKNNGVINEQQARDVISKCLTVLYYRDGRAYDKVKFEIYF
jgi:20S proteasome subunit beta 7